MLFSETTFIGSNEKAAIKNPLRRAAQREADPARRSFLNFQVEAIEAGFACAQSEIARYAVACGFWPQLAEAVVAARGEPSSKAAELCSVADIGVFRFVAAQVGRSSAYVRTIDTKRKTWVELWSDQAMGEIQTVNCSGSMRALVRLMTEAAAALRPVSLAQKLVPTAPAKVNWF